MWIEGASTYRDLSITLIDLKMRTPVLITRVTKLKLKRSKILIKGFTMFQKLCLYAELGQLSDIGKG